MNKKNVGRKTKLNEDEIKKVIRLFKEKEQPSGIIKYADIHRFANRLYGDGLISASTSDAFWRKEDRLGRTFVDKANKVFSDTVLTSKGNVITVPDVSDLFEKKYKDKKLLLKHLIEMENQLRQSLQREKKISEKLIAAEAKLDEEKAIRNKIKEQNIILQNLVFKLYRHFSEIRNPRGKEMVDYAMKNIFFSPTAFYIEKNKDGEHLENVINVKQNDERKNNLSNRFRKD